MGIVIAMVLVPGLFELKSVAVLKLELEMQRQAGRLAMTTKGGLSRMTEVGKVLVPVTATTELKSRYKFSIRAHAEPTGITCLA